MSRLREYLIEGRLNALADILTIGEILVEFMTKENGQRFDQSGEFVGPFPSGAPAIFINQVAKIGSSAGIIATIGEDAFGNLNYNKLKNEGVDVSLISKTNLLTTGVAFVTYQDNGERDFIYHLNNSASSLVNVENITEESFKDCKYFHVMGTALFNEEIRQAVRKAISICKKLNITISFDPNIRKELLVDQSMREFLNDVLSHCQIFLPGEDELKYFTNSANEEKAVQELLAKGINYIVVKRGSDGCKGYSKNEQFELEPYLVTEVGPTGAGDCFAGTLISCLNQEMSFKQAAIYANAAGAHAVSKLGPMEGNATLSVLEQFQQGNK